MLDKLESIAPLPKGGSETPGATCPPQPAVDTGLRASPETLRATNRFVANPALTERTLLVDVLPARPPAVDVDDEDWRTDLAAALHARGTSRLVSTSGATSALAQAIRGSLWWTR